MAVKGKVCRECGGSKFHIMKDETTNQIETYCAECGFAGYEAEEKHVCPHCQYTKQGDEEL